MDDYDKLRKDYMHSYKRFLKRQPQVEDNRSVLLSSLGECRQLMGLLEDKSSLQTPRFWDETLTGEAREKVRTNFEKRVGGQQVEEEVHDITKEVDKYLQQKYNDAHQS